MDSHCNRISSVLRKCVWIIWGIFTVYTFINMLFLKKITQMPSMNATDGYNILYFAVAGLISFLIFTLLKKYGKQRISESRKYRYILIGCSLLLYMLQLVIIKSIWFETGWDMSCVYYDAIHRAEEGTLLGAHGYFTMHPNNMFLTFIFSLFDKILYTIGITRYYILLCCLGALLLNISGLFVYHIVRKMTNSCRTAIIAWIIYACFIGISPWICVPYTDVYSIIFPIMIYSLYLWKPGKQWKNISRWILIGFLTVTGYHIKPTVAIITIAIAIELIIRLLENKTVWKNCILALTAATVGCIMGIGLYAFSVQYMGFIPDKDREFPVAHYWMLGQNDRTYGAFAGEDWNFVTSFETREDKVTNSVEGAKERIRNRGILGNIRFYSVKNMVNYDNATFSWAYEGDFFVDIPSGTNGLSKILKSIYYPDGKYYKTYATICQGVWLVLFFGCIGVLWDKNRKYMEVPCIAIIGLTIFLLLFESRARYIFLYTPVYVLLGCIGIRNIYNKIWEIWNGRVKHSDRA